MSSFKKETKNPKTGEWEKAEWLDDFFGNHNYGVVFPSDLKEGYSRRDVAYKADNYKFETRPN